MKINKQKFLAKLKKGLSGLPQSDIEERLAFYEEMIDDRMEDGLMVILAVYLVLWSILLALWAVEVSLWAYTLCGIASGIAIIFYNNVFSGLALIGTALVCAGLSIFLFFGCKAATKGTLLLTQKITRGIKNMFIKKEDA